ncbi:MAG: MSHA biogenesis protein MshG [Methylophilaceae bacterium 17-44-8]|nr:MAG: MSHA biogenesis protein MshG [Methylophilales bacterium 28-44-11]OYZ10132.1 MAG: MSHA biogenesis protein MshG [Methylophilales bacterium 16-45-7]OZA06454.1 MAG: MSHA biogenesis protein MshG [Methylophilaceae bacterium 17-44-8]
MPAYSYTGRDANGAQVTGVLEAADTNAMVNLLQTSNITPILIEQARKAVETKVTLPNMFEEKITSLDIMLFSRQMYTLLKAGIPIMQALGGLQASTKNQRMAAVVGDLRQSLDGGRELSAAMAEHPKVFNGFYVSMVRVGETTGMMDNIFLRLFNHLEFERFMHGQIKAALRYPTFVLIAMAVAIVVINIFVIPSFAKVFDSMHAELPLLTRVLLGFSNLMLAYWPVLIGGAVGIAFLFKRYIATTVGRYKWDTFKLSIPIAGKIVQKGTMARFARSFALASKSGVPITNALKLVAQTIDNEYIAKKVDGMRAGIERGESILRTANSAGVFNPLVLQMIAVGEESGALDDLMQEIADMYQRDMEYEIKTLGAQIEPILIVFLGVMVLILALGIFLPVWDLGKVALHK